MERARVTRSWGHSEGREVCLGRWGSSGEEDPAQTLSLPTALEEVLGQWLAAGLQDERDQDDGHFPENIHQPGRLPFSCDPVMPWEIRLSRAASCYPLTFLLSVPEILANLLLRGKNPPPKNQQKKPPLKQKKHTNKKMRMIFV